MGFWTRWKQLWAMPARASEDLRREEIRARDDLHRSEIRSWENLLDDIWVDGDEDPIYDYWYISSFDKSRALAMGPEAQPVPVVTFDATLMDDERHPVASYKVAAANVGAEVAPTEKREVYEHTVNEVVSVAGHRAVVVGRCWVFKDRSATQLPEHERVAPVTELIEEVAQRGFTVREI